MQIWHGAVIVLAFAAAVFQAPGELRDPLAALNDACPDIRGSATARLRAVPPGVPPDLVVDRLAALLRTDPYADVREGAAESLGWRQSERAASALLAALDDPDLQVAAAAARGLKKYDDGRGAARLVELSESPHGFVQIAAWQTLGGLIGRRIVTDEAIVTRLTAALAATFRDRPTEGSTTRGAAAEAMGSMRRPETIPVLLAAIQDEDSGVRGRAWMAIRSLPDPRLVGPLVAVLQSVRRGQSANEAAGAGFSAADALGKIKDSAAVDPLRAMLATGDIDDFLRSGIVEALGNIGSASAVPEVSRLVHSSSQHVREAAREALPKLTDQAPVRKLPASAIRVPPVAELIGPPLPREHRIFATYTYEIPEGYRGFLSIDFHTPSCPPLEEAGGRATVRFGRDGRACTSTEWRFPSFDRESEAYSVGPSGRVRLPYAPPHAMRSIGPLPLTERLPSRDTIRAGLFAGSEADARAARGCKP